MRRILVADHSPDFFLDSLKNRGFEIDYQPEIDREAFRDSSAECYAVLIKSALILDAGYFENCPQLRLILRPGSGLDNVDVHAAETRGVQIINSPEGNCDAVGEHVIGAFLAMVNNIPRAFDQVKSHQWIREPNRGEEIGEMQIGIIGVGNTGSAVYRKLEGFGTRRIPHDKYKPFIESIGMESHALEEIFTHADAVTLHLPLTGETRHYANREFFSSFQKPVWFINAARGGVTNAVDLLEAINDGKVKGAILDVLENEDLASYSKDEWALLDDLIGTGKVLLTPHIAGWTHAAKRKMFQILLDKMEN